MSTVITSVAVVQDASEHYESSGFDVDFFGNVFPVRNPGTIELWHLDVSGISESITGALDACKSRVSQSVSLVKFVAVPDVSNYQPRIDRLECYRQELVHFKATFLSENSGQLNDIALDMVGL